MNAGLQLEQKRRSLPELVIYFGRIYIISSGTHENRPLACFYIDDNFNLIAHLSSRFNSINLHRVRTTL